MGSEHKKTLGLLLALGALILFLFWSLSSGLDFFKLLEIDPIEEGALRKPKGVNLQKGKDYSAVLKTDFGDIVIDLYELDAPYTVTNFVYLANEDFYDGTSFYRIIKDFLIQGGDPVGDGSGGPGYTFNDEINNHKIVKGALAMANNGPNTNGSQFFIITEKAQPHLDGKNTVFGEIVNGFEVLQNISAVEVKDNGAGEFSLPIIPVLLKDVEIVIE